MVAPPIDIPVIDISGFYHGDAGAKKAVVDQFRTACSTQGFMQVVGHTVSRQLQEEFLAALRTFFALPLEEKAKISQANSECNRGYEILGGQKLEELEGNATADQKEGFSVRQERDGNRFLQGRNQWPDNLPGYREKYMEYYYATHEVSKTLFKLMALSLDLPENYFERFANDEDGLCLCRSHHYPPAPPDATDDVRYVPRQRFLWRP
jgi:isopenicillin N synthase-like dioxygenase